MTNHHLKWGLLPPNEVGRITYYVMENEGKEERESGEAYGKEIAENF